MKEDFEIAREEIGNLKRSNESLKQELCATKKRASEGDPRERQIAKERVTSLEKLVTSMRQQIQELEVAKKDAITAAQAQVIIVG